MIKFFDSYLDFCLFGTKFKILQYIKKEMRVNKYKDFSFIEVSKERSHFSILTLIELNFDNNIEYMLVTGNMITKEDPNTNEALSHSDNIIYKNKEMLIKEIPIFLNNAILCWEVCFYSNIKEKLLLIETQKKVEKF